MARYGQDYRSQDWAATGRSNRYERQYGHRGRGGGRRDRYGAEYREEGGWGMTNLYNHMMHGGYGREYSGYQRDRFGREPFSGGIYNNEHPAGGYSYGFGRGYDAQGGFGYSSERPRREQETRYRFGPLDADSRYDQGYGRGGY